MVFINDKKYACEKCIKGHRVSGCTHTDRPLYEVKKKGRPTTQCQHCKEKRKSTGSSVHTKCSCGDNTTKPSSSVQPPPSSEDDAGIPASQARPEIQIQSSAQTEKAPVEVETRKGQPGSRATFPRGLKDVHELAAAANALAGLGEDDGVIKVAERKVSALLNPCKCQSGGPCKCCHPKKSDRTDSPGEGWSVFSDYLRPTIDSSPAGGCCSSPSSSMLGRSGSLSASSAHLSPGNMHHPAHTSPHVHKTKLYSPYSAPDVQTRHGRRDTLGGGRSSDRSSPNPRSLRPPPPRIRPLTDMGRLIGAALNQDGTLVSEIPRSVVGLPKLPGISAFDTAAENGGVKVEPMEMEDVDMPLAFPTSEDVVIGACMCGEDCACAGCATHDNGKPSAEHPHEGACGEGCKGHHDCGHSIAVPSGVTSIAQLISLAASHVPPPPEATRYATLDPHDTRVLPPAVQLSEDAARTMGVVQLKPLECCNGRCQCSPGQCTCEKECCGCCVRCACDEEDENARIVEDQDDPSAASQAQATSSCCSSKAAPPAPPSSQPSPTPSPIHLSPITATGPNTMPRQPSPTLLSPDHARTPSHPSSRNHSPIPSSPSSPLFVPTIGATGSAASLRRATSTSSGSAGNSGPGPSGRRATVTGNPPALAPSSKSAAKAAAPYPATQHRAILPKPPTQSSSSLLTVNTAVSAGGSRQPSPGAIRHSRNSSSSGGPTRTGSPIGVDRRASAGSVSGRGRSLSSSNLPQSPSQPQVQALPQGPSSQQPTPQSSQQDFAQLSAFAWPPQTQEQEQAQGAPSAPSFPQQQSQHSQTMYHQLPTLQIPDIDSTLLPSGVPETSATTPQIDFDPLLNLNMPNNEIMAFLQQWSTYNSTAPQPQSQPQPQPSPSLPSIDRWSWAQSGPYPPRTQVPGLQADLSGDTSPELDQPFDIEQFLSQALAKQSAGPEQQLEQTVIGDTRSMSGEGSGSNMGSRSGIDLSSLGDYFVDSNLSNQQNVPSLPYLSIPSMAMATVPTSGVDNLAPPPMRPDLSRNPSNGIENNLPHTPDDQAPIYPGLVPGFDQEMLYEPWATQGVVDQRRKSDPVAPSQPLAGIGTGSGDRGRGQDHGGGNEKREDHIVDLSKPLDAAALSKIMRALQQHGEQSPSEGSTSHAQGHRQSSSLSHIPQHAHSNPPSDIHPHSQHQASRSLQHSQRPSYSSSNGMAVGVGGASGLGVNGPTINMNTNMGSGSGSGAAGSAGAKELDDMFNQYVTLDGTATSQGRGQADLALPDIAMGGLWGEMNEHVGDRANGTEGEWTQMGFGTLSRPWGQ